KALMKLGVQKGEHIAIWADNQPEWITTQFAVGKMGAVLVTVNTNYQATELGYLLKQSEATTLIMAESYKGTSYVDIIKQACPELEHAKKGNLVSEALPYLKNIIIISDDQNANSYTWQETTEQGRAVACAASEESKHTLDPDDVTNMQDTSGTRRFPKGVMRTHHNIVNN